MRSSTAPTPLNGVAVNPQLSTNPFGPIAMVTAGSATAARSDSLNAVQTVNGQATPSTADTLKTVTMIVLPRASTAGAVVVGTTGQAAPAQVIAPVKMPSGTGSPNQPLPVTSSSTPPRHNSTVEVAVPAQANALSPTVVVKGEAMSPKSNTIAPVGVPTATTHSDQPVQVTVSMALPNKPGTVGVVVSSSNTAVGQSTMSPVSGSRPMTASPVNPITVSSASALVPSTVGIVTTNGDHKPVDIETVHTPSSQSAPFGLTAVEPHTVAQPRVGITDTVDGSKTVGTRAPTASPVTTTTSTVADSTAVVSVGVHDVPTGAINTVSAGAAVLPFIIPKLRAGTFNEEENKAAIASLSAEDLAKAIESIAGNLGLENERQETGLAKLFVQQFSERLQNLTKLSPTLKLGIGNYYRSVRDDKCVALYESILASIPQPTNTECAALTRLAQYYAETKQFEKAGDTLSRAAQYSSSNIFLPLSFLDGARYYNVAGNFDKAEALYTKIPQYNFIWATGMALYDRASLKIQQNKHSEARQLLQQPLSGQNAEQVKVGLLALLAYSYYCTEEFESATTVANEAIKQFKALANPFKGENIENQAASAQEILRRIELWKKQPLISEAREWTIYLLPAESGSKKVMRRFFVSVKHSTPLVITSDKPALEVRPGSDIKSRAYDVRQDVIIEFVPEKAGPVFDAFVTISSPQYPKHQLRVPVHVRKLGVTP